MKLIIAVVEDTDAPSLIEKLVEAGVQATKLASTGGFLLHGNTTLLIGVDDSRVNEVIEIISKTCQRRKKLIPQAASELPTAIHFPIEVEAGGAVVFVIDVGEFHRL